MFRGANKLTLDNKGRMVMPTRYRERLQERCGGKLVVTVDKDQCLLIYPLPDWEQIERKLMELPSLQSAGAAAAAADGRVTPRISDSMGTAGCCCRRTCASSPR